MTTAYVIVTGITILANMGVAAAGLARADFVVENSTAVGVPRSLVPLLAALKATGAAGLLAGLLGPDIIGVAAAVGLVAFFIGAVVAHLRARVLHSIAFPVFFLALATASLALSMTR